MATPVWETQYRPLFEFLCDFTSTAGNKMGSGVVTPSLGNTAPGLRASFCVR